MCKESGVYGSEGQFAFIPVAAGFLFGAIFVFGTDKFLDYLGINSANMMMSEYFVISLNYSSVIWVDMNIHSISKNNNNNLFSRKTIICILLENN